MYPSRPRGPQVVVCCTLFASCLHSRRSQVPEFVPGSSTAKVLELYARQESPGVWTDCSPYSNCAAPSASAFRPAALTVQCHSLATFFASSGS
ncbi:hypothetical protein BT67DRAFT_438618, partial [Trichocladium antarcticum]